MNELLVERLKTARTDKCLKQQDVAEQLGIKANTISNWEKGRTEPDIDTFVKLCDIYEIDCASLLSDVYAFKRISKDITLAEYNHIKKYRDLDSHGREMVDFVLEREHERITSSKNKVTHIEDARTQYMPANAAHERMGKHSEEDRLNDENMLD